MTRLPFNRRLAAAGVLLVALAGCAATSTRESAGEYFDDTSITTRVKTELLAHKDVSAAAVNVETFKGRVQLSGFVKTPQQRSKAGELARAVKGVNEVVNDIQLR
jgi:osmotically-inducible protein OsmY